MDGSFLLEAQSSFWLLNFFHNPPLTRKDLTGGSLGLPTGNAYSKAVAAKQASSKIALLQEHIGSLNQLGVDLKLQNESLHSRVIDYQRRYRSLKEQYEGEQESWLTERVVLESKAKEVCVYLPEKGYTTSSSDYQ